MCIRDRCCLRARSGRRDRGAQSWKPIREVVFGVALLVAMNVSSVRAAEYGTGPWVKGYTDIFGGVLPSQPGWYSRTDVYHYDGNVDTTIFNGRIANKEKEKYTATL